MTKTLPAKSPRKTTKPKFEVTPAMQIRFEKAMASVGRTADKEARKDDKIQREARLAIAETLEIWIEWMLDENTDQVEDIFLSLAPSPQRPTAAVCSSTLRRPKASRIGLRSRSLIGRKLMKLKRLPLQQPKPTKLRKTAQHLEVRKTIQLTDCAANIK